MRIYTRAGDGGLTGLADGARVSKAAPRVSAYGDVDEFNSTLGVLVAEGVPAETGAVLAEVQSALFAVGTLLADPTGSEPLSDVLRDTNWIERWIDSMEADLEPLQNFIVPGGCKAAALAQLARTVCRRAERHVVGVRDAGGEVGAVIPFLNRLSDAMFVLARWLNRRAGVADTPWHGPR